LNDSGSTMSSRFDKQAKWGGWILGAGLIALTAKYVLPFLLTIVWQGVALVIGLAVLGVFAAILLDERARKALFLGYRNLARAFTRLLVKTDPEGYLRGCEEEMTEQKNVVGKKSGIVRGVWEKLLRFLENRREVLEKQIELARGAQELGQADQMTVHIRYAEGLEKSIKKGEALATKLELIMKALDKWLRMMDIRLQEVRNDIELISTERTVVRAAFDAFKSAWQLLKGGVDKQLYDMATEEIMNDISMKMGQMSGFLNSTDELFRDFDLEEAILARDSGKKLNDLMARVDALADKANEVNLIEPGTTASATRIITADSSALKKLARGR
jgi:hypothetical protein